MTRSWIWSLGVVTLAMASVLSGCLSPDLEPDRDDPDQELAEALRDYELAREQGLTGEGVRVRLERMALTHPNQPDLLLANATIANEMKETLKARRYLDQLFRIEPIHPEGAILRARVAIEEGNAKFAERMLAQQINYRPDHNGLHEAHAGALYLLGRLPEAARSLDRAESLGAATWRVNYHRGLIAEAQKDMTRAASYYDQVLAERPDYGPAISRRRGLESNR